MSTAEAAELALSIGRPYGEDLPDATMKLKRELSREGIAVEQPQGAAPSQSKSGMALTAGSLVISGALSTAMVRSLTQVVLAFIHRGVAEEITLTRGDSKLSVKNASRETERIVTAWLTGQPADTTDDTR